MSLSVEDAATEAWGDLLGQDDNSQTEEPEVTDQVDETVEVDEGNAPADEPQDLEDDDEFVAEDGDDEESDEELEADSDVEDDEQDADAPTTATAAIELSEDDVIRLPNGEEVAVKDAVLFQAGFTKKTQELAERTAELEAQQEQAEEAIQRYEQVAEQYQDDAPGLIRQLIAGTQDPTYTFAATLKGMADDGTLDPAFAETFQLAVSKARDIADTGETTERLSKLEQQLQEEREAAVAAQRQQQLVNHYLGQWNEIKTKHGLEFESPEAERQAWRDTVAFAAQGEITDLRLAYAARAYEQEGRQAPARKTASPAQQKRKRTSARVARRSSSGGGKAAAKTDKGPLSLDDAISESLAELASQGS